MSLQDGAIKQPANDLAAFDLCKRSPEQIVALFARWKEQRKRLNGNEVPEDTRKSRTPRFMPVLVRSAAEDEARDDRAPSPPAEPLRAEPRSVQYSASFAAILASGSSKAVIRPRSFGPDLAPLSRPRPPRRRPKRRWVLAGAVSILAVTAAAAATLWHDIRPLQFADSAGRPEEMPVGAATASGSEPVPAANYGRQAGTIAAPIVVPDIQTAARLLPMATEPSDAGSWNSAIDAALMQPAPVVTETEQTKLESKLKPRVAKVQTASKIAAIQRPASISQTPASVSSSTLRPQPNVAISAQPAPLEKAAPSPVTVPQDVPVKPAARESQKTHTLALYRRGNDKTIAAIRPSAFAPAPASETHSDDESVGTATGGTGNSGVGGSANGGDTGEGSSGAGSPGGDSGSGDTGGSGSSGSGDSGGLGGAVGGLGGTIGGAGDAVGGALGGQDTGDGHGNGKGKDKDKGKSE